MIYTSVQPDIPYFHWQIEVMLTNFQDIGIEKCHVILITQGEPSAKGKEIESRFPQYEFFFYQDERSIQLKYYIPTIKPHGMYLHARMHQINEPIFYHDSDIIFTEKIDENRFENDDVWYMSDTISYIGSQYVKSKGEKQFDEMCNLLGVSREVVESNADSSGGAQYIMKNATAEYWEKVCIDSYYLYQLLEQKEGEWNGEGYPIQKWCAEMWATLWNIWFFNHKTCVDKELNFTFATDSLERQNNCKIMHNAGVTLDRTDLFFKGAFIDTVPFEADLSFVDSQYCSHLYKLAIERVVQDRKLD